VRPVAAYEVYRATSAASLVAPGNKLQPERSRLPKRLRRGDEDDDFDGALHRESDAGWCLLEAGHRP
jgi:hypothetical protein